MTNEEFYQAMKAKGQVIGEGRPVGEAMAKVETTTKKVKSKLPPKLIKTGFKVLFDAVEFTIPIKVDSPGSNRGVFNKANMGRPAKYRNAWFYALAPHLRDVVFLVEAAHRGEPVHVTFTRLAPGLMDADDNLNGCFKEMRDAVALSFGMKDDIKGVLKWHYEQIRRAFYGSVVRLSLTTDKS
jgi:hypothetical protein